MNSRPLVFGVISYIVGHIIASIGNWQQILLLLVAIFMLITILKVSSYIGWKYSIVLVLLLCSGFSQRLIVDYYNHSQIHHSTNDEFEVVGQGVIVSEVEVDGDTVKFVLESKSILLAQQATHYEQRERFMVHVKLKEEYEQITARTWHRGMLVTLHGQLSEPAEASNDGAFDYRNYLKNQRIHWLWKVQFSNVSVEPAKRSIHLLLHKIDVVRASIASPLDELFDAVESGYLKGLILGIRADVDPEQFRSFSTLGLTHILAISGLHVAVFMYIITALLKLLRRTKEQIIICLLLLIPCYVVVTGGSPSVVRAGLMAMLALLLALKGKLKDGLHIIFIVAALLIAWEPYMLHNVSFQLSFIVTLGLIIGVPAIQSVLPSSRNWKWFNDLFSVTFVAQIISFPLTIYYFNQFHLLSLFANFLLVPFISMLVMPLSSFSLLLGHISTDLALPIVKLVHWCNQLSFGLVEYLSEMSIFHSIWASPSYIWISLWYGIWLYIFHRWRLMPRGEPLVVEERNKETAPIAPINDWLDIYEKQKKKNYLPLQSVLCYTIVAGLLLVAYSPYSWSKASYVSFLDIGQGDASLITTPTGKHILIDGGGSIQFGEQEQWKIRKDPFEVGKKVLLPLLMKRGIQQIDLLVISHLDADHIGGLYEVLKVIPVKEIWWNGSVTSSKEASALFELIVERNIPLYIPTIGEQKEVDRYTLIDVLWPNADSKSTIDFIEKQNEYSLVLMIKIYHSTFLYTGDIGKSSEAAIVNKTIENKQNEFIEQSIKVDVMKAAHHGSRYSTDYIWLSYFQPIVTVISAGKNNRYGHPHPDVLKRLQQYSSLVQRTDEQGEIKFKVTREQLYKMDWK